MKNKNEDLLLFIDFNGFCKVGDLGPRGRELSVCRTELNSWFHRSRDESELPVHTAFQHLPKTYKRKITIFSLQNLK